MYALVAVGVFFFLRGLLLMVLNKLLFSFSVLMLFMGFHLISLYSRVYLTLKYGKAWIFFTNSLLKFMSFFLI